MQTNKPTTYALLGLLLAVLVVMLTTHQTPSRAPAVEQTIPKRNLNYTESVDLLRTTPSEREILAYLEENNISYKGPAQISGSASELIDMSVNTGEGLVPLRVVFTRGWVTGWSY